MKTNFLTTTDLIEIVKRNLKRMENKENPELFDIRYYENLTIFGLLYFHLLLTIEQRQNIEALEIRNTKVYQEFNKKV